MRVERHFDDSDSFGANSFGRLGFSPKVQRLLERDTAPPVSRLATDAEINTVLEKAARIFPVAPLSAVTRMRRRNRTIIRVIEGLGDQDDPTMLAYLPLSTEGARRLVEGR